MAFVIAQVLKVFTYWYSERRWDFTRLIGSGGMPSSHTGCVSPLANSHCPNSAIFLHKRPCLRADTGHTLASLGWMWWHAEGQICTSNRHTARVSSSSTGLLISFAECMTHKQSERGFICAWALLRGCCVLGPVEVLHTARVAASIMCMYRWWR